MPDVADVARAHVLAEHRELVGTVIDCADAVASGWDGAATVDRERVVSPMRATLDRAGVLEALADVLVDAADAAGYELSAPPVAAPPYVTVTSRGPMLRATVDPGRLVVTIAVFDVERGDDVSYTRTAAEPEESVVAELR